MSRCFPFPPAGYTLSRAGNEALIESIKLRNEREKVKEQKRREKKEKGKEKKEEKRKDKREDRNQNLEKSDAANSQTLGKECLVTKDELQLQGKEAQTEQLEGSSLTEEHLLPPIRSDIPSTSSDSTNTSSNKRKRDSLPLNENHGLGKIIRIKLSSKQNGANAFANANEMGPCSKSGNTIASKMEYSNNNLRFGRENSSPTLKFDGGQIFSTSKPVESISKGKNGLPSVPKAPKDSCNLGRENSSSAPKIVGEKICSTFQSVEGVTIRKNEIPSVPMAPKGDSNTNLRDGRENSTAALKIAGEMICSTFQSVEGVTKQKNEIPYVPKAPKGDSNNNLSARENSTAALKIAGEKICSTSQPVEGVTKGNNGILSVPKAVTSHVQIKELRYNELVGNLSIHQLQNPCLVVEDLDWLLKNPAEKRQKIQNDGVSCSSSFALRPCAQLLNGFDIYALPFTVPF